MSNRAALFPSASTQRALRSPSCRADPTLSPRPRSSKWKRANPLCSRSLIARTCLTFGFSFEEDPAAAEPRAPPAVGFRTALAASLNILVGRVMSSCYVIEWRIENDGWVRNFRPEFSSNASSLQQRKQNSPGCSDPLLALCPYCFSTARACACVRYMHVDRVT